MNDQISHLHTDIDRLAPWFHNLHLPGGVQTMGIHPYYGDFPARKWKKIAPFLPDDMTGMTALDIGCNAGFYTFEMARRGASVTALDIDEHYLAQARWASGVLGLQERITFRNAPVYDLARETEGYDIVLFLGVFYHLRYPQLAMDIVTPLAKQFFVFQTLTYPDDAVIEIPEDVPIHERTQLAQEGWPKMAYVERYLAGDPTNWWVCNHAAVLGLLRDAGMNVVAIPGEEVYVCQPDRNRAHARGWNWNEYLSATGQTAQNGQLSGVRL
jgi:tRNA (mo5U34)-methyltransferase